MKKYILLVVFVLLFLLSDVSYLIHGVRCTYLRGESSAQIDDYKFFHTRPVSSDNTYFLPVGKNFSDNVKNSKLDSLLVASKSVAFLVFQKDSLRVESYWQNTNKNSKTNSFSMAKSIVSVLIGSAIKEGYIKSVDQSIFDFVPEMKKRSFLGHDVKIKHLINMSSGYDWLENYKRPISVTAKAYYGKNIRHLILNKKFVEEPGKIHRYSSGSTQLLGIVLERAVKESISDFTGRVLWSKIGANESALWSLDREGGMEKVFCCFNSSARDFLKFGVLMLDGGFSRVTKEDVVSKEYFNWLLSVPKLIDGKKNTDSYVDYYSNGWWVADVLDRNIFYARGFLGQWIVVIPSLDLVFVRLGKKDNQETELKNSFMLTDNLLFTIKSVIEDFSL